MKTTESRSYLDSKNMSMQLLIPLVFTRDELKNDLIEIINSIRNCYVFDKNIPYIEDTLVIEVDDEKSNELNLDLFDISPMLITRYSARFTRGNEVCFSTIYHFKINDAYADAYGKIKSNDYFSLTHDEKMRILSFWNSSVNSNLYNSLMVSAIEPIDVASEVLEEKDFIPDISTSIIDDSECEEISNPSDLYTCLSAVLE